MLHNPNLLVTEFNDIKQSIINKYKNDPNSPFKDYDFEGSSISYLIDILSYITLYNNYYAHMSVNDLFLPFAQQPKNVYALARSLGYLPKRPTSAYAEVKLTLEGLYNEDRSRDIVIPAYTQLKSKKGTYYLLMEDVIFRYNTVYNKWMCVKNDVFEELDYKYYYKIKQGTFNTKTFYPTLLPQQKLLIKDFNIDDSKNSIIVQDTKTYRYWKPFYDIVDFNLEKQEDDLLSLNTLEELKDEIILNNNWDKHLLNLEQAEIYFIDGDENGIYISFGDNVVGKIPENPLNIYYIKTVGEKGNGDSSFIFQGSINYNKNDGSIGILDLKNVAVNIKPFTTSVGGSEAESVDSIRRLAPSFFNTQNRSVIDLDYEVFLYQQKSVPLDNVKCIGGEMMTPPIMGSVGICANKKIENGDIEKSLLTFEEQELLRMVLKNKNVVTINPIFISPEFVRINIYTKIFYNPIKTEEYVVHNDGRQIIESYFKLIKGFKKYFKSSNLIQYLDENDNISHNLTSADFDYYRILYKKDLKQTVYVNFGIKNELKRNSIKKCKNCESFIKMFNPNTYYEIDAIIPPTGSTSFNIDDYKNNPTDTITNIHKIFLYDFEEEVLNDSEGYLYITEKYVKTLKAKPLQSSSGFTFEYNEIVLTGKKKLIGKIYYNRGLIKLYFDDNSFRYLNENKKYKFLALETKLEVERTFVGLQEFENITVDNIDSISDGYSSYTDLFFKKYNFDDVTNLPYDETGNPSVPEDVDKFIFSFYFDTINEDFSSLGNIIMIEGDITIEKIKETE